MAHPRSSKAETAFRGCTLSKGRRTSGASVRASSSKILLAGIGDAGKTVNCMTLSCLAKSTNIRAMTVSSIRPALRGACDKGCPM